MVAITPRHRHPTEVAPDVALETTLFVNTYFIGDPAGAHGWILVDAGLPGFADRIRQAAQQRFGHSARPSAIVLTHGHFDHVGSLRALADLWNVPIYAHP